MKLTSYSQYKQDIQIYNKFFKKQRSGFFVDIGAHDGISFSNSFFFEKLGWQGICFEPNPDVYQELRRNRKCRSLNLAVSDKKRFNSFLKVSTPLNSAEKTEMLSGLYNNYDPRHLERLYNEVNNENCNVEIIDLECTTWKLAVTELDIDYLSIDTEGNELNILKSIPFEMYNISVISVEINFEPEEFFEFFKDIKYSFFKKIESDYVFYNPLHFKRNFFFNYQRIMK